MQGGGAALVMPLAVALLTAAFPPQRRGPSDGHLTAFTGLAVAGGPVLGGAVTQGLAWQWIFWLNVPVGLLAIPFVLRRVPDDRAAAASSAGPGATAGAGATTAGPTGPRASVDVPGLLLFTPGATGLVWGLVRADAAGWGSAEVTGSLAAGAVLVAAFVARQARARTPMVPLRFSAPAPSPRATPSSSCSTRP